MTGYGRRQQKQGWGGTLGPLLCTTTHLFGDVECVVVGDVQQWPFFPLASLNQKSQVPLVLMAYRAGHDAVGERLITAVFFLSLFLLSFLFLPYTSLSPPKLKENKKGGIWGTLLLCNKTELKNRKKCSLKTRFTSFERITGLRVV